MNSPLGVSCLVVLVGPPGSGKSTWALRNSAGAVHVSQDDLIDAITPHGFEHAYRFVYAAAEDAAARAALAGGHTVIVDRTNRTAAHRSRWIRIAREVGQPVVAVEMNTPAWLCHKRNSARRGPRRVSKPRMERMLAALEPVGRDEGFTAVYAGDTVTLAQILSEVQAKEQLADEHCHQTR